VLDRLRESFIIKHSPWLKEMVQYLLRLSNKMLRKLERNIIDWRERDFASRSFGLPDEDD